MKKILLLVLSLGVLGMLSESTTEAYCSSCTYSTYSYVPSSYSYSPYYNDYSGGCCRGSLHWGGYWY